LRNWEIVSFERANSFIDQEFGTSEPDSEEGSIPSHTKLDMTVQVEIPQLFFPEILPEAHFPAMFCRYLLLLLLDCNKMSPLQNLTPPHSITHEPDTAPKTVRPFPLPICTAADACSRGSSLFSRSSLMSLLYLGYLFPSGF
jgi:hypothetical protein